jgi:hypothetical protein
MIVKRLTSLIVILAFFFCYLAVEANKGKTPWKAKVKSKNGMKIVENPTEPFWGVFEPELEENLHLSYGKEENDIFGWISKIQVDHENNIYLLDSEKYKILSFDSNGKYRFGFGNKGNGPGEFRRPLDFFVDKNGKIYVLDEQLIHILGSNGEYHNQIKLTHNAHNFFINEDNNFIISFLSYSKNERRKEIVVGYFDPNSTIKKEIGHYVEGEVVKRKIDGKNMVFHLYHRYTPELYLTRSFDNKCIFGFSTSYTLTIVNEKGEILLKINKNEAPAPVSLEEKNKFYEEYALYYEKKWSKQILKEALQFPPHRPFFNNILVDDKGRIYVSRLKSILNKKNDDSAFLFDVFDRDGYFIYQMKLSILPQLIKEGYIYSIYVTEDEEEEENISIRRFKIKNWAEIKTSCGTVPGEKL